MIWRVTLDREWLIASARHERTALGTTIQYAPPERWDAESPREGWTVKDVIAHLASVEVAAAAVVGGEGAIELEEYRKSLGNEPFTPDAFGEWSVARRRDNPTVSLALEWGRAADLLLNRASSASPEDWTARQVPWLIGDLPLGYLVQTRLNDWWVCGEDIRIGAGLPSRREHPPIHSVCDFAIRSLPYWLSVAGKTFPGKSLLVELDGAGEGTWNCSLAPREQPPAGKKPDVVIGGRAEAFAQLAAGRMDPDVALYEGLVNAGGDSRIADAVLENLRLIG